MQQLWGLDCLYELRPDLNLFSRSLEGWNHFISVHFNCSMYAHDFLLCNPYSFSVH
uniref:Uncharacterized protein n=1 Tax=Aegilops tauschii subsp. strangulata TaxID=200361 RepID=A0A453B6K9_AEGTS